MNVDDEYNVAARYRTIRKHLDSLGYRQALSLDALPLIEKLLADLIQTTDSLKHFKEVAHNNVEACSQLQLSIDPYKCDNARLVQECNQLHLDLIEAKESHQRQIKDWKRKIYNLESECGDLQSASSRNLKRIKELETESSLKSKRIQELLGKCCKPLINNVGLASKKRPAYPLRRPSLEAEPLPRIKSNSSLPSLNKVEPSVVDLLAMADRKMNGLNQEVTRLKGELDLQVDSVYTLKAQLAIKEKEILRMKKMLEGGRPYSAVSRDCSCKKSDQCCDREVHEKVSDHHSVCHKISDTADLRILQQVKADLEQQLREALDKQHDAMSQAMKLAERNEELEKELRDIDHIALAVEADCNSAVKENNKRVSQLQEKLESVMTQVHVLEGELMVERRSGQELRADLEGARLENRNLKRKLESTLDEKKHMTDRINELTVIEQSLNVEIGRLARDNENLKREIVRLDCANNQLKKKIQSDEVSQSVKEDSKRVKEKGEKNDRNKGKMLTKKKSASRGQRRSFSPPVHEKQTETSRRYGDTRDDEVTRDSNIETTRIQKLNTDNAAKIHQLQQTIDQVQKDRDYYKNEYNRLREQSVKNSEADNAELWGQVCELRRQLLDKEHAVLDLQREKKELCREKFELELRLQSSRSERRSAYHPCGRCRPIDGCSCSAPAPLAGGDSRASTAMVERLERERAAALADVDRLVQERDSLRERLKLAVEAHKFEQRRLRESLCDVENRLKKLEQERQDLLVAQGTNRATIDGFEDQLEDLRDELRKTKQELSTQRTQYFQLRTLQDQADQALGDVQGQLNHSESELYKAMDRNRLLEQQRMQLDNEVKELKQEISTLRGNMSRGDQEKDQLLMDLEDKNGRIATLERELKAKEQEVSRADQQSQELQHKYQLCVDQSAEQERRLRNMQMEMEIHQRQLAAASTDRDNAAQENRRLQDDLAAVTCEIRTLQRELEASRAESSDLKRQLQTYVSEVRRAEELINRKENERTEMLNHFRSLSLEATMLENNNHSLESEAAETRGALQSARDRSLDLERQLADRDCLIRGYETQINELTQTVAGLETQMRQQIDQRQRAEADLNAVRDLCVKLDQQKETLVKELGDKDATKAQYEAQLARLRAEQNMIQDQLNRDHVTVERLETLLDQARQESMDSQTANQELQCEMSRLKQKICELQNKLSSESAELRRYQNQSAEYSKQIGELRRQVTNERFDRARKEEEHRRNCQCGESGSSKRNEKFPGDSSPCSAAPRCLDSGAPNASGSPTSRYGQSVEEYRQRGDLRIEAQRTNRFNGSGASKVSPLTICGCSESNSKILNPDSSTARAEQLRAGVSTSTEKSPPINEQAHRGSPPCGLCVRATVEEDDEHKDIRVRISDVSAFVNNDGDKEKTAVVKFCTPLVCEEATRRISSTNDADEISVAKTNDSSSLPHVDETSGKELPSLTVDGRNETPRSSLSSKINKTLRCLNCRGKSNGANKARADRDETGNGEKIMESATPNSDDTSAYEPSNTTNLRSRSFDAMQNPQWSNNQLGEEENREAVDETLRILRRLLEKAGRPEVEGRRSKFERSRSVPRGRSRECESDLARSNVSFPVRVDYSRAALTAADLTRPEFVQMLTEIKEQTKNLEQQLSQMNSAMRSASFNDAVTDTGKAEREKSRVRHPREETEDDASHTSYGSESVEGLRDRGLPVSRNGFGGKSRKTKKNKKTKDASLPSDFSEIDGIVASTPEGRKKNEEKSTEEDIGAKNVRHRGVGLEATKSNVTFARGNENVPKSRHDIETSTQDRRRESPVDDLRVSRNRLVVLRSNEASAGTQTTPLPRLTSTVDEAVVVKPSKIHKLKKSPKSTSTQRPETRPKTGENSVKAARSADRKWPSASPGSPGRTNWSPEDASRTGSLIPCGENSVKSARSADRKWPSASPGSPGRTNWSPEDASRTGSLIPYGENSVKSARSADRKWPSASPGSPGRTNWSPEDASRTGSLIPYGENSVKSARSADRKWPSASPGSPGRTNWSPEDASRTGSAIPCGETSVKSARSADRKWPSASPRSPGRTNWSPEDASRTGSAIPSGETSVKSARSADRKWPSASPGSPGRTNWSMENASRTGSLIPMRQSAHSKPRSAPARSTASRMAAGASTADVPPPGRPETPSESEQPRGRSSTPFFLRKLSSRSNSSSQTRGTSESPAPASKMATGSSTADLPPPGRPETPSRSEQPRGRSPTPFFPRKLSPRSNSSSQTRGPSESPNRRPEVGSRQDNSETVSVRDSIALRTLHDTLEDSASRGQGRSEITETQRNRIRSSTPVESTSGTVKKSAGERGNGKTGRIFLDESDTCETSQGDPRINGGTKKLARSARQRTPEIGRADNKNKNNTRLIDDSRAGGPSGYTVGALFEGRTSGMIFLRDGGPVDDERPSRASSRSPASRSRKLESENEFSSTNRSSNNARLARVRPTRVAENAEKRATNYLKPEYDNDRKSRIQQRSKSDTRESRDNAGRDSR